MAYRLNTLTVRCPLMAMATDCGLAVCAGIVRDARLKQGEPVHFTPRNLASLP